ncbi:hypothetical protein M8C21_003358 [Ambrosia artemisiifolia]|uniref:SAM domain-containing protein n=1 Tax=Ambrosia artemisiifolia TaxID=4212 RepID=A0AAD5GVB3_AMBAR|nr:hypothetical protein M8C21_003358 [Ambrosia artemisiifolia]
MTVVVFMTAVIVIEKGTVIQGGVIDHGHGPETVLGIMIDQGPWEFTSPSSIDLYGSVDNQGSAVSKRALTECDLSEPVFKKQKGENLGGNDLVSESVSVNSVGGWLEDAGFGRYEGVFEMHEVDEEALPLITVDDLKEMGLLAVGTRRKLYAAICQLKGNHAPIDVPTGVGASIGGYVGDALAVARTLAYVADCVIYHPNGIGAIGVKWGASGSKRDVMLVASHRPLVSSSRLNVLEAVLNAAMLYWPMPNVLYVEGYALDRFAESL